MRAEFTIKGSEPSVKEKMTQVFSESLKRWREEEPFKLEGYELFYCPVCSYVVAETRRFVERYGRPRCWACGGIKMTDFDEVQFMELRRRLADEALSIAPRIVEALLEVAEAHGFYILFVEIHDSVLYIYPSFTNGFSYDAGARRFEAYFHRYDVPRHVEALKTLVKKALELGLGILVQINPTYMKMPIPYDLPAVQPGRGFFYGVEVEMSAEGLRNFFAARGL